jgi:pyruvate dehydrogenase E2 component (dihydrolipoamide acetyltransferase)
MPALGMSQDTGRLVAWRKKEGETVSKGDVLMEVETDKTTVEVEANASGTLVNVTAQAGADVPVGTVIAWIVGPGEKSPASVVDAATPVAMTPIARRIAADLGVDVSRIPAQGKRITRADVEAFANGQRHVLASPKARRLAAENGLDLVALAGSGPDGAVLAGDVLSAVTLTAPPEVLAVPEVAQASPAQTGTMWRRMAERLAESWQVIPHFYLRRDVDATGLINWRQQITSRAEQKVTYTDLLLKLVAAALRQHPYVNGQWTGTTVTFNEQVNIGLAVALDDGLIVPVIHDTDHLGVIAIAERRRQLVDRAQKNRLQPADLQGGTFTISNLGMFGIDEFSAIVNPPQAAILAVGRIRDQIVPVDGQAVIRPVLTLSLSCDHRAVDGARGARFLDMLARLVNDPLELLD